MPQSSASYSQLPAADSSRNDSRGGSRSRSQTGRPQPQYSNHDRNDLHEDQDTSSSPVILSQPSSPLGSANTSPERPSAHSQPLQTLTKNGESVRYGTSHSNHNIQSQWSRRSGDEERGEVDGIADADDEDMSTDQGRARRRASEAQGYDQPLLRGKSESYDEDRRLSIHSRRRSLMRERDPDLEAKKATRKRYTYAFFFLIVSLISFTVQTETAVYIQHNLKWNKAYAMLYFTHGSWSCLWFLQLAILRAQKWSMPWKQFWARHKEILRHTAQMVEHQDVHAHIKYPNKSPIPYMLRTVAFVTSALTVAGGSWYVAVDWTTASDLTAIYNCSAFFAYVFSVPLLKEAFNWTKTGAVLVAVAGVIVVAYGDSITPKHGSKSGGGTGGPQADDDEPENRTMGNLVIAVGSVLYGLYEVLYKKYACPPEGASPGRSMIFANCVASLIGGFTLCVLWIPLPILHFLDIERFQWPTGEVAWVLLISVLGNAIFSGSFLVLISLTSPVLSSVAALLTIFLVALVDQLLPPPLNSPLTGAAIAGGVLIIIAFVVLCWATYREMDEERKKKADEEIDDSDAEVDLG